MNELELKNLSEKIRLYSQKFVLPFYLKNESDNMVFSATLTLVEYKTRFFGLTAAHAIPKNYDLNKGIYVIGLNGEVDISSLTLVHRFDDVDLIILDFHAKHFSEDRYYFNLDIGYPKKSFREDMFIWSGFPAKKTKDIGKENPKTLASQGINGNLMTFAKSLLAGIPFKENYTFNSMDEYFYGHSDLRNASYAKEGIKSKGYSYRGMSGGAFCLLNIKNFYLVSEDNSCLTGNKLFYFIGIGIEHKKDNTVVGVGRKIILEKLEEIIKTPVEFSFILTKDSISIE